MHQLEIGLNFSNRAGRRKVVTGEGMLVATQTFTWQGARYKAGITRVSPDHPVCASRHAALLKPAYERESSPLILRFLERQRAQASQASGECRGSERRRLGTPYWRLPTRAWRLR